MKALDGELKHRNWTSSSASLASVGCGKSTLLTYEQVWRALRGPARIHGASSERRSFRQDFRGLGLSGTRQCMAQRFGENNRSSCSDASIFPTRTGQSNRPLPRAGRLADSASVQPLQLFRRQATARLDRRVACDRAGHPPDGGPFSELEADGASPGCVTDYGRLDGLTSNVCSSLHKEFEESYQRQDSDETKGPASVRDEIDLKFCSPRSYEDIQVSRSQRNVVRRLFDHGGSLDGEDEARDPRRWKSTLTAKFSAGCFP